MQIFLFVDGHNEDGIQRVQQTFRQFQPSLHEGEPLTVAVLVVTVHVIIVVLPVACARIVRRVNVYAVHLSRIEILQELQGMVVICLDKRMPEVTVRCVADGIDGFEIRINRLPEFRDADKVVHRNINDIASVFGVTGSDTASQFRYRIEVVDLTRPQRHF